MKYTYTGDYACICEGQLWNPGETKASSVTINNSLFVRVVERPRSKHGTVVSDEVLPSG